MKNFVSKLGTFAVKRPLVVMIIALIVWGGSIAVLRSLEFDTAFSALLPTDDPTVQEVNWVKEKAGGTVDLIVALKSEGKIDEKKRLAFARRLVDALRKEPWVRRADTEYNVEFFEDRRLYFLSVKKLEALDKALSKDIKHAKARANPLYVDLEDEDDEDAVKPWSNVKKIVNDVDAGGYDKAIVKKYLTSKDNRYQFIRMKPKGSGYNLAESKAAMAKVDAIIAKLEPAKFGLSYQYSGAMPINQAVNESMSEDLKRAAVLALVLVLLLLTIVTRQIAVPLILAVPLLLGISITLAITTVTIGQLNIVSGFLVTALIGVGIDYGIHLYLRFLEEMRRAATRAQAMWVAMQRTFPGCLTSSLTTFAAFAAMTYSDFRGFREYGQIAAMGVLITLITTFLVLPPLAMGLSLIRRKEARPPLKVGFAFRRPLAWSMVFVGVAFTLYAVPASFQVPFYNNFTREMQGDLPATKFGNYVSESMGGTLAPALVAVDSVDGMREVERLVKARGLQSNSPFKRVVSLATAMPPNLEQRQAVIKRLHAQLSDLLDKDLKKDDRAQVEKYRRWAAAKPWTIEEIPKEFQRWLRSIDQTLYFALLWPDMDLGIDTNQAIWSKEIESLRGQLASQGITARFLDENLVAAQVIGKIRADGPYVMAYAGLAIVLLLIIDFRNFRSVALVASTLGVGFVWIFGGMYALGMEINVFNMAVLPTVLGIGIDNAVHVMHRYLEEGRGSVAKVVATTGVASVLASVTTGIGFGAALVAHHNGIRGMGELAVVAFTAALLASTALFPAILRVLEGRDVSASKNVAGRESSLPTS